MNSGVTIRMIPPQQSGSRRHADSGASIALAFSPRRRGQALTVLTVAERRLAGASVLVTVSVRAVPSRA